MPGQTRRKMDFNRLKQINVFAAQLLHFRYVSVLMCISSLISQVKNNPFFHNRWFYSNYQLPNISVLILKQYELWLASMVSIKNNIFFWVYLGWLNNCEAGDFPFLCPAFPQFKFAHKVAIGPKTVASAFYGLYNQRRTQLQTELQPATANCQLTTCNRSLSGEAAAHN